MPTMFTTKVMVGIAKFLLGLSVRTEVPLSNKQKVYFANHSSHIDTIAIFSALPPRERKQTKPVAAKDYWGKNKFIRFIAEQGLNCVLIERYNAKNSLEPVLQQLDIGKSLILFPEGTRGDSETPSHFKSGIYHIYKDHPEIDFIPVYLNNLHRAMRKGKFLPLPVLCNVRLGKPLEYVENESKDEFLNRAYQSLIGLKDHE